MRRRILIVVCVAVFAVVGFWYAHFQNAREQAVFAVHALGRYLHAHKIATGEEIVSLSGLPDVCIAAPEHSLRICTRDLKKRMHRGYFYNLQSVKNKGFVISASPAGWRLFPVEFGMTKDLNLRINTENVDADSDSYDEVTSWPIYVVDYDLMTQMQSR